MTRLTTVGHVPPAQREDPKRQPTGDFAQALAKDHEATSHGRLQAKPVGQTPAASAPAMAKAPTPSRVAQPAVTAASAPHHTSPDGALMAVERVSLAVAVNPVGMTEALQYARVFGVHLLPDCYLSEVAVRDAVGREAAPAMAGYTAVGGIHAPLPSAEADTLPAVMAGGDGATPAREAAVAMVAMESEAESRSMTEAAAPSGVAQSGGAAAVVWSERTLRITGEREGHAVAWIRDYRLDRHDEERLVQAVLQEARTQGVMLRQIIVNGREAWASREAI